MAIDFSAGDTLEHVQLNNMVLAAKEWGVLDGLAVSEHAAGAAMLVDVATGNAFIDNTKYTETSITWLGIAASHATKYRKDLITYDPTTEAPIVTKGTDHAGGESDPIYPPDIPSGDILLAIVDVDAGATTIVDADIHDARIIVAIETWDILPVQDGLLDSDMTERTTTSTSYVKANEITIPSTVQYDSIELYITWQMKIGHQFSTAYSKVYRNGVAVGAEKSTSDTDYVTCTDTLSGWSMGDKIQIYYYGSSGTCNCYVDDLEIHGVCGKLW